MRDQTRGMGNEQYYARTDGIIIQCSSTDSARGVCAKTYFKIHPSESEKPTPRFTADGCDDNCDRGSQTMITITTQG